MLAITIRYKTHEAFKIFKCPAFECIYEKDKFIAIPVHILAPFIKQSTYLDEIELIIDNIRYIHGELYFCRSSDKCLQNFRDLVIFSSINRII